MEHGTTVADELAMDQVTNGEDVVNDAALASRAAA
jgi:hypothetical protein